MRLIDADKLKVYRCDDSASRATFDYIYEDDIEDAPTIDLVKCVECKWCEKSGGILWCNTWHDDTNGLNFCSYAERRADGDI